MKAVCYTVCMIFTTSFMFSSAWAAEEALLAARIAKAEIAETKPEIPITRAVAALNPTKKNQANGTVHFHQVEGGVQIVANVEGLTPGKHGFHIHEFGDCSSPDARSAGAHFNPFHQKHGGPEHAERHVGDLGNLVADKYGFAHYERIDSIIQLNGPNSIIGKAIIVNANPDDLTTQPEGNSGARISCGIIEAR